MGILSKIVATSSILLIADGRRHLDDKDIAIKRLPVKNRDQERTMEKATGIVQSPLVKASECEELCFFKQ